MIKYSKNVTDIWWQEWLRVEALVLIDGKFYGGSNHQWAMTDYMADYWSSRDYDLEIDSDMGEAIAHTDDLFKQGKVHGFDVFEEGYTRYLISHYPRAFKDKEAVKCIKTFADKYGYKLGTFMNEEKLGNECYLIEITDEAA